MPRTKTTRAKNVVIKAVSDDDDMESVSCSSLANSIKNQEISQKEKHHGHEKIEVSLSNENYAEILQEIENENYSPLWEISLEGMPAINSVDIKFSVFTPGESSVGQIVTKIVCEPNTNRSLLKWITSPLEKNVLITIRDHESNLIEKWKGRGIPVAMAIEDLTHENPMPWCCVLQIMLRDIEISS